MEAADDKQDDDDISEKVQLFIRPFGIDVRLAATDSGKDLVFGESSAAGG